MTLRHRGKQAASLGVRWTVSSLGIAVLSFDAPRPPVPGRSLVPERASGTPFESLTPAEARVASLVAVGGTNREIAQRLGVSVRTVANQVASILRKQKLGSRFELVRTFSA
jgi:DNA-binding NarL/FixJ family response regulator